MVANKIDIMCLCEVNQELFDNLKNLCTDKNYIRMLPIE